VAGQWQNQEKLTTSMWWVSKKDRGLRQIFLFRDGGERVRRDYGHRISGYWERGGTSTAVDIILKKKG